MEALVRQAPGLDVAGLHVKLVLDLATGVLQKIARARNHRAYANILNARNDVEFASAMGRSNLPALARKLETICHEYNI